MTKVNMIVEHSSDCLSAYSEEVGGIIGMGETLTELHESVAECINLVKEHNDRGDVPEVLFQPFELVFCILESIIVWLSERNSPEETGVKNA